MKPREDEMQERRRRRIEKYVKSLPAAQRSLTKDEFDALFAQGYVANDGKLTDKGQLKLHQLELLEWMKKRAKKESK
jgi:hypothetical protein